MHALDPFFLYIKSWCRTGVGNLFTITGRMNCASSLAGR